MDSAKDRVQVRWWRRGFTCNDQRDPHGKKWAVHRHQVDEIVVLLEGQITVKVGQGSHRLHIGEELVVPRLVTHSISNTGPHQAHYLYGFRHKHPH